MRKPQKTNVEDNSRGRYCNEKFMQIKYNNSQVSSRNMKEQGIM